MKSEVNIHNDLDDDLFIYLENKVRENSESNEESMLYEELMMKGKVHRRFNKVIQKLKREMESE